MSDKKKPTVDQDLIRELAALLDETGLTEIEVESEDTRIRIARNARTEVVQAPAPVQPPAAQAQAKPEPAAPTEPSHHAGAVISPMVGTAYRAPEPGGRPYVDVGDVVREGQTLLIVEAMKTMNQIPAPRGGTIARILVEDGQPVEYGEPLMIIE